MTIDELARAAATTTRNVRAWQSRGLLPPPQMEGRIGRYGSTHLARLRLVASLQERGYSLAAIADLLRAFDERRSVSELLGSHDIAPHYSDEPEIVLTRAEMQARFPLPDFGDELTARVLELGLIVPLPPDRPGGQERYRITSPKLLEVGRALYDSGVPIESALDELAALRDHAREIAARFVGLFTRFVWDPWIAAGQRAEDIPALIERARKLQPLPPIAVSSVVATALDAEVARVVAERARSVKPR